MSTITIEEAYITVYAEEDNNDKTVAEIILNELQELLETDQGIPSDIYVRLFRIKRADAHFLELSYAARKAAHEQEADEGFDYPQHVFDEDGTMLDHMKQVIDYVPDN